jgi:hypothetical protein
VLTASRIPARHIAHNCTPKYFNIKLSKLFK